MYTITAVNLCREIVIENAQNKQDAVTKAEIKVGKTLLDPIVKFKLSRRSNHYNPKSFRYPEETKRTRK